MKKIISMLLVLTIVVTTLVGVMVVDVNAGVIPEVENVKTPRVWTLNYTSATGSEAKQIMATGKYILKPETKAADGEDFYELGEITSEKVFGMDSYHFNFEKTVTFKSGKAGISNSYTRLQSTYSDAEKDATAPSTTTRFGTNGGYLTLNPNSDDFAGKVICGDGTNANGKVLRYTFYAYSTKDKSQTLAIQVACKTGGFASLYLPGGDLYSPKGIPHKIDVYVWSDSKDKVVFGKDKENNKINKNEFVYIAAIIDGNRTISSGSSAKLYAKVAEGGSGVNQTDGILHPLAFYSLSQSTNKKFTVTETDSYIMHPYAEDGWEQLDRSEVSDDLFKNINLGASTTDYSATDKTGFITGFGKYNEKLEESLRTSTNNASIEIFESHYNNPASIYANYDASNVKVISKTSSKVLSADELSKLTSMDNHYFIVNGVYVVPVAVADPVTYLEGAGVPFKVGSHNTVTTRTRHENFIDNVNTGDAFGGLQNGFYRFTNEPRSGIAFSDGGSLYNSNGYFALTLYNGELEIKNSTESSYLTKYNVEKNIVTAEFDAYFPEYPSGNFSLNISFVDDGAGKPQNKLIFNSSNKASTVNGNIVDVTGNSWNRIAIAFDMTDTPTSGKIAIKAYVNGKLQKTFYSNDGDYKDEAKVQFAPLAYLRLYAPKYVSYGTLGSGKWYVGNYTPSVPAVSEHKITPSNEVFVSESDLLIASNLSEDKLIELMKDYIPVYKITYNIKAINDKYDAVDGTVTELKDQNAYKAFKGKVIKRWIEKSPHFTVTDGVDGKKVYTLKDTQGERAHIISAVDNGEGEATIAFNGNKDYSFDDSVTYPGVCTGLPDIIAQTENAVEKKLVGFATVEAGKLPKVYTLTESGLNLRDLTFNKGTSKAELSYRKFGNVANAVSFQLVVAAYDKDGKLLELKSDKPQTINSSTTDGESIITFAPGFSAATLSETNHYKVFMFDSLVNCIPLFKSAKITK